MRDQVYIYPRHPTLNPTSLMVGDGQFNLLSIVSYKGIIASVEFNDEVPFPDQLEALKRYVGTGYSVSLEPPELSHVMIWDSLFRKPAPVYNLELWESSREAEGYVYAPNDLSKSNIYAEDFLGNAHVTQILLNAYQDMCLIEDIAPCIILQNGTLIPVKSLTCFDGSQAGTQGESSARLANSTLDHFQDSKYLQTFMKCLRNLKPYQYDNEAVRVKVVSRVELILVGTTERVDNRKFINRWLKLCPEDLYEMSIMILQKLTGEGEALEIAKDKFISRCARMNHVEKIPRLLEVYESCLTE